MEKQEMSLQDALALITHYGLTVTSTDGKVKAKPRKRISNRRPKGSGSVVNLGKGRNKPYGAFVTIGYDDETGKQIQKSVGYFRTREEALSALELYNTQKKGVAKEDYSKIKKSDMPTFKEIWNIIYEQDISKKSRATYLNYNAGFNNLSKIHSYKLDQLNLHALQPIFENTMKKGASESKLNFMKIVCKSVFNYAMKYDYIDKDYSSFISFEGTSLKTNERKPYTLEEIKLLIKDNTFESKLILISIFTGLRPQELVGITKNNVYIDKGYMIGGMKTKSGRNRVIPIHDFIKPFIFELMDRKTIYLVYDFNGRRAYDKYRMSYEKKVTSLGITHLPYDCRHTFATISKLSGMSEFARKRILGHSSNDLTDDVYTHTTEKYLIDEIKKFNIELIDNNI